MLKAQPDRGIEQHFQAYVAEILGINAQVTTWRGAGKLPYFLQDAYDVKEWAAFGQLALVAFERWSKQRRGLVSIREQMATLEQVGGMPSIYVTDELASYERKRLIEQHVQFVVPGNQLYIPRFGLDLRERFRSSSRHRVEKLSPAAQAMVISALLRHPWTPLLEPREMTSQLGYTAMTQSRAVRELIATGVAVLERNKGMRILNVVRGPRETWKFTKPLLRNPIKTRFWADTIPSLKRPHLRLAGLSALARYSHIASPASPTFALTSAQLGAQHVAYKAHDPRPGLCEWQIWSYSPELMPDSGTVDLLSLALSLEGTNDERIEQALEQMEETLPW